MDAAGVPAAAIEALLAKEAAGSTAPVADVAAPVDTTVADNVTVAPTADNADISYFYDSMANDGKWTNDADNGWSWSPTVAVGDANWRPYVDNGSWVYTDDGWYWNSGYSWGWSAFHYGRWSHRDNNWSWQPDNVWGSSWVSWRNNDGYYGWAPLTPRARFEGGGFGVALTTGNFDLNIGLGEGDYCFVHSNDFLSVDLNRRQISRNEATNIYRNSTVTNNYTSSNGRMSNQGIPVKSVALATKQTIKPVTITDHPAKAGEAVHAGGMQNGKLEVFRPTLAAKASMDPVASAARRTEAQSKRGATATKPNVAKLAVATGREAELKAAAVKRVSERASKEPRVQPTALTTPRRESAEPKTSVPPSRTPEGRTPVETKTPNEPKTPAERAPARTPETREPARAETPRAHEAVPTPKEPAKTEPQTRTAPPARTEQPARSEQPARTEQPARAEPRAHTAPPARTEQPARAESPARTEQPARAEPPARTEK
jgi:hypothetical protein